jgi:hypothetical protein
MNEPKKLRPASAVRWVDQVVRLEAFRRRNPGVMIQSPRQAGGRDWIASWDEEEGSMTITRPELRDVLDIVEERFGVPG